MRVRKAKAVPGACVRADRSCELVCLALMLALATLAGRIVSIL